MMYVFQILLIFKIAGHSHVACPHATEYHKQSDAWVDASWRQIDLIY